MLQMCFKKHEKVDGKFDLAVQTLIYQILVPFLIRHLLNMLEIQ